MNFLNFSLKDKIPQIDAWFRAEFEKTPPPPYCSVDLRNSGFKLAPVDTNLFPAGFNNLSEHNLPQAVQSAQALAIHYVPACKRILIIPENHTRNMFYFESLAVLQFIFIQAGFEVRIGSLLAEIQKSQIIQLKSGKTLTLYPVKKHENKISAGDFEPCMILLNHDLSGGIPEILQNITQKIAPPLALGWWSRKKSEHFLHYQQTCELFAAEFKLDPWLINADFDVCQDIDFVTHHHEDLLIQKTEKLLAKITQKYQQYEIKNTPYVVIKADSGTYGMGILTLSSTEQIKQLNHKQRQHMAATKGNQKISQVIIQEGVYTIETSKTSETADGHPAVAEPVIYMLETSVIGGFYRINKNRQSNENLNAPGMTFEPFDIFKCAYFDHYKIIARLALLAAAKELRGI